MKNEYAGALPFMLAVLLAGCTPDSEQAATAGDDGRSEPNQASTLPSGLLEQLAERYPVLRQEPAGEPVPSSAAGAAAIPAEVRSKLPEPVLESIEGEATFYANKFEGRRTASGIPFRQNQLVAAHRGYPFGTLLRVTNLRNDRSVNVRVVDRGPHGGSAKARNTVLDLSRRAAERLDYIGAGRAPVRVEVLEWGEGIPRVG